MKDLLPLARVRVSMSSIMAQRTHDSLATRETLLERLKDCGDQNSWQEFYDTYRDLIYGFALKAGLTEIEAEDVVQETAIGVARKLPEFKFDPAQCTFRTWLLNLTAWRIKDQIRKRLEPGQASCQAAKGRRLSANSEGTNRTSTVERVPDSTVEQLEACWEADWKNTIVAMALKRVKADANLKDCQMFDLHVLRRMPPGETARALGVSVGRVYLAKHRIGRLVKKQIAKMEMQAI
jgi:RNA polymerase sigma factor (sigma-70 family)